MLFGRKAARLSSIHGQDPQRVAARRAQRASGVGPDGERPGHHLGLAETLVQGRIRHLEHLAGLRSAVSERIEPRHGGGRQFRTRRAPGFAEAGNRDRGQGRPASARCKPRKRAPHRIQGLVGPHGGRGLCLPCERSTDRLRSHCPGIPRRRFLAAAVFLRPRESHVIGAFWPIRTYPRVANASHDVAQYSELRLNYEITQSFAACV